MRYWVDRTVIGMMTNPDETVSREFAKFVPATQRFLGEAVCREIWKFMLEGSIETCARNVAYAT
ncbi:MAG: hypothetical protein HOP33_19415 [Verrucomicrobia bacterium]|nr:hypothetical protein [Verrucomicrobiota bacterium]